MKTLLIQTHDLARNLQPDSYTCHRLEDYLVNAHGVNWRAARRLAHVVMGMLYKEQKEFRRFNGLDFYTLEDVFDVTKYVGTYASNHKRFSEIGLAEIRQRLINSLLTRPDRTLCVLIPE